MIRFYKEDTSFEYKKKLQTKNWLKLVASSEIRTIGDVNIILCSDNYVLDINIKYLGHDYFTDIITFDYCEGKKLSGDLFISVDCVRENSIFYNTEFSDELDRVIVHGLLHLIGYDDHTDEQKKIMRSKEDYYLSLRSVVK